MQISNMRYRPMGNCGMKLSELSLGSWLTYGDDVTDSALIKQLVHQAFDAGINFFDIADVYARGGAEQALNPIIKEFPRHHLVLSSKVFWPMSDHVNDRGLSRKHIMESIDNSLKRLGTDYLDIYFCHRYDTDTPLEETIRAMDDLVHQGKVLYWGTSVWSGDQLRDTHRLCRERGYYAPQVEQPQYSLLCRKDVEIDVQPAATEAGMGLVLWSPLAFGLLTGKYDDKIPGDARLAKQEWLKDMHLNDTNIGRVKQMKAIADELGCTRAQLSLAWLLKQPGVSSVITGATKPEQLQDNLGALNVTVTDEVNQKLKDLFAYQTNGRAGLPPSRKHSNKYGERR